MKGRLLLVVVLLRGHATDGYPRRIVLRDGKITPTFTVRGNLPEVSLVMLHVDCPPLRSLFALSPLCSLSRLQPPTAARPIQGFPL